MEGADNPAPPFDTRDLPAEAERVNGWAPSLFASVRDLPPNIFAIVMATGIVSLAVDGAGLHILARLLFGLNVAGYGVLVVLFVIRGVRFRAALVTDLANHAKAPGFFTLVAAPCVLGNQCILLADATFAGQILLVVGVAFWLALSFLMLPRLMEGEHKPTAEHGLSGAWLLVVVGTQAISVLLCLLAPARTLEQAEFYLFVALSFWLLGSMLYIWLIALIFHRIVFLPLPPGELTPPYWINMGAMAISTLAGVRLIEQAARMPLLDELLPFLKGFTLLFWTTGSWWIPILLSFGVWRHLVKGVPLTYEHGYWAAVFPLGMYTVCTQNLIRSLGLLFLEPIPAVAVWVAFAAWSLTFAGLVRHVVWNAARRPVGVSTGSGP
jgi:tellurite resistance protein TehA-like permease